MQTALIMGLLASSAFPIGVAIGLFFDLPRRLLAGIIAFGAGVLVVALTSELMAEATEGGYIVWAVAGLLLGSIVYVVLDHFVEQGAKESPRREGRDADDVKPGAAAIPETDSQATISGMAVLVGTVLDGVPENAAIGIGLAAEQGPALGYVLLGAVFLSNLPGAIASTVGMQKEGRSTTYIVVAWTLVALACTTSCVLGYAAFGRVAAGLAESDPGGRRRRHPGNAGRHDVSRSVRERRPLGRALRHGRLCRRVHPDRDRALIPSAPRAGPLRRADRAFVGRGLTLPYWPSEGSGQRASV